MLKNLTDHKYYFIFVVLGILIFSWHSIRSGFDLMPGDNIDSRYINYILEHFWLWVNQTAPHQQLWNMPCLYPAKNTLAFSDVLFGIGIFYVPLRLLFNPYNAFLLTSLLLCILNFSSFYFLLKNCFKFKDLSSAAGAFFFAFSIIRYGQIVHIQLLSQFYTILALICFIYSKKYKILSFAGCIFIVLQFYTSFYMGWFIAFSIFILSFILIFFKDISKQIFNYINENKLYLFFNLLLLILLLLPLAIHYLATGVTKYPYDVVLQLTPTLKNYFINQSLLDNILFFKFRNLNVDDIYGIGIFATFLLCYGIYSLKNYKKIILIFIISIFAIINISFLHKIVYDYFPAGGTIRAVGRFVNILCPIFAYIFASIIENFNKNILKLLVIFVLIIEQIPAQNLFLYSKKDAIKDIQKYTIPDTCSVIFLNYSNIPAENYLLLNKIEVDAMWLALTHKIYTVNGYPTIPMNRIPVKLSSECIIELK